MESLRFPARIGTDLISQLCLNFSSVFVSDNNIIEPVRFAEIWLLQMSIRCKRKNIVPSLKSTAEIVLENRAIKQE